MALSTSDKYHMYAFDAGDGKLLWKKSYGWNRDHHGGAMQHPVIVDDTVDVFAINSESHHQPLDEYAYLDFDFTGDDAYNLETRGANRLVLRSVAEVAEAMRVIPIEKVPINEFF